MQDMLGKELEIGSEICDIHNGLPVNQFNVLSSVRLAVKNSNEILTVMCDKAGVKVPHNKIAVIVGHSSNVAGALTAAYSYDGHTFGMFCFTIHK